MANLFAKAAAAPKKATTAKVKDEVRVEIDGFEQYAAVDAVLKSIEAVKKTLEQSMKSFGIANFIQRGMTVQKRPVNFVGHEGKAEGSIQLKAKASNIGISVEDQERLAAADIPLKTTDTVVTTFIINPAYAQDEALLEKVSKALSKVAGLPEDFIQHQSEQKVVVDGDTTLDALFRLKDASQIEALLPAVASIAIRPGYKGKMMDAFELVGEMLSPEEGE